MPCNRFNGRGNHARNNAVATIVLANIQKWGLEMHGFFESEPLFHRRDMHSKQLRIIGAWLSQNVRRVRHRCFESAVVLHHDFTKDTGSTLTFTEFCKAASELGYRISHHGGPMFDHVFLERRSK